MGEETPLDDVLHLNNMSIDNTILNTTINMVDGEDMSSRGAAGTACQKGQQTLHHRHVVLVRSRERLMWRL